MHSQKLIFTFSVRPQHVQFYEMNLKRNRKWDRGNESSFAKTVRFILSTLPIKLPSTTNRWVNWHRTLHRCKISCPIYFSWVRAEVVSYRLIWLDYDDNGVIPTIIEGFLYSRNCTESYNTISSYIYRNSVLGIISLLHTWGNWGS